MKTTFEVVTASRTFAGPCPKCGKRRTRSQRVEHTVNPYNRNPDGSMKTRAEVRVAVDAELDKWTPDFTCATHAPDGA